MILADTSIWIDHLRAGDAELARRLSAGAIACHPFVVAEIALGSLRDRDGVLTLLDRLPGLPVAEAREVRTLIDARHLFSRGIGYVDASLVASCLLAPGSSLWTRDRRLAAIAEELEIGL
ncbi:MAG: type II toxin-antitoxin system VapC family toxin [Alteraurantiacibacter sp.]